MVLSTMDEGPGYWRSVWKEGEARDIEQEVPGRTRKVIVGAQAAKPKRRQACPVRTDTKRGGRVAKGHASQRPA